MESAETLTSENPTTVLKRLYLALGFDSCRSVRSAMKAVGGPINSHISSQGPSWDAVSEPLLDTILCEIWGRLPPGSGWDGRREEVLAWLTNKDKRNTKDEIEKLAMKLKEYITQHLSSKAAYVKKTKVEATLNTEGSGEVGQGNRGRPWAL